MAPTLGSIYVTNRKIADSIDILEDLRARLRRFGDRWAVVEVERVLNKLKEVTNG